MAITKGSSGVVKVGSDTIAETTDWSLDETADVIETTNLASTARTYVAGLPSATGSVTCHWDPTDTTGQGAMTAAAGVTLNVYPSGSASGATFATFSAIMTSIGNASGGSDGLVSASYTFTVTDGITWGTV